jgi:hypothetical protein
MNDQSERHSASSMSHSPHQAASQNDQSLANAGNHEFENTNTNNNNNILKVYIYTTCGRKSTSRDGSPHAEQDRNSHEEGGQGQDTRPAHNRPNDFAHHYHDLGQHINSTASHLLMATMDTTQPTAVFNLVPEVLEVLSPTRTRTTLVMVR